MDHQIAATTISAGPFGGYDARFASPGSLSQAYKILGLHRRSVSDPKTFSFPQIHRRVLLQASCAVPKPTLSQRLAHAQLCVAFTTSPHGDCPLLPIPSNAAVSMPPTSEFWPTSPNTMSSNTSHDPLSLMISFRISYITHGTV